MIWSRLIVSALAFAASGCAVDRVTTVSLRGPDGETRPAPYRVLFHDDEGAWLHGASSMADGVSIELDEPAWVTVLEREESWVLPRSVRLEPGDDLVLRTALGASSSGRLAITVPPLPIGTDCVTASIGGDVGTTMDLDATTVALWVPGWQIDRGHGTVLLEASAGGVPLAYGLIHDVDLRPLADEEVDQVAASLGAWRTDLASIDVRVTGAGLDAGAWSRAWVREEGAWFATTGVDAEAGAPLDGVVRAPPGFGELVDVTLGVGGSWHSTFHAALPAAVEIEADALLAAVEGTTVEGGAAAPVAVTWAPLDPEADVARLWYSELTPEGGRAWQVEIPHEVERFVFPRLPAELAAAQPHGLGWTADLVAYDHDWLDGYGAWLDRDPRRTYEAGDVSRGSGQIARDPRESGP